MEQTKWTNTIYVISNPHYNISEICKNGIISIVKIGSTKYLPARYYNYITYNPVKSKIERFYYLNNYNCYKLDDDFKKYFNKQRIHLDGGTEFYDISVVNLLEEYMKTRNIEFTKYEDTEDFPPMSFATMQYEINDRQQRLEYDKTKPDETDTLGKNKIIFKERQIDYRKELIPDQLRILYLTVEYFKTHNKGIWNLFCRYGKTRLSCLFAKYSNYNKILILVPSLYLVAQTAITWQTYYKYNEIVKVCSSENDTLDTETIKLKHQDANIKVFITTYQSSNKFKGLDFDLCIYDEAHRTTGDESTYKVLLDLEDIRNKLFLTATMKYYNYYDGNGGDCDITINSMDDIVKYGDIIEKVSARRALELKRICPFTILTLKLKELQDMTVLRDVEQSVNIYLDNELLGDDNKDDKIYKYIKNNQARYIRIAYGLIQTILNKSINHTITFHRYVLGIKVFTKIINKFLELLNQEMYCNHIDGNMNKTKRLDLIKKFQEENIITILCSAKVLQEGVDIPDCDSVCFVDAKTSIVDCTQSLSRCLTYKKNKHSNIIIPFDETDLIETNDPVNDSIKLSPYAMDLRILLRNIVEIDDNIKEYFRKFIENDLSKSVGHSNVKNENNGLDIELLKCIVDSTIINKLSDIAYDIISVAKQKIKGKYTSATDYVYNVRSDFGKDLPLNPDIIYRTFGWHGWNDYLGIDRFMPLSDIRKHMQRVNKQLLDNGQKIIISKKEYQAYAKENNMMVEANPRYDNWCWLLLPNYDKEVENYYKNKEDIIEALKKLEIKNINDYEKKSIMDSKLAPYDYIVNGFYNKDIPIISKSVSTFISSLWISDEDSFF
jgi:superfamily II DNA or RNA helicase